MRVRHDEAYPRLYLHTFAYIFWIVISQRVPPKRNFGAFDHPAIANGILIKMEIIISETRQNVD